MVTFGARVSVFSLILSDSTTSGHVYSGRAKIITVPLGASASVLDVSSAARILIAYHVGPGMLVNASEGPPVAGICFKLSTIAERETHETDC